MEGRPGSHGMEHSFEDEHEAKNPPASPRPCRGAAGAVRQLCPPTCRASSASWLVWCSGESSEEAEPQGAPPARHLGLAVARPLSVTRWLGPRRPESLLSPAARLCVSFRPRSPGSRAAPCWVPSSRL